MFLCQNENQNKFSFSIFDTMRYKRSNINIDKRFVRRYIVNIRKWRWSSHIEPRTLFRALLVYYLPIDVLSILFIKSILVNFKINCLSIDPVCSSVFKKNFFLLISENMNSMWFQKMTTRTKRMFSINSYFLHFVYHFSFLYFFLYSLTRLNRRSSSLSLYELTKRWAAQSFSFI